MGSGGIVVLTHMTTRDVSGMEISMISKSGIRFNTRNVTVLMIMYGSVVKTWIILSNVIMIPENIRLATGAMIRMDAVNAKLMAIGNVKTTRNVAETGISMN